jgi:hypothetical protein
MASLEIALRAVRRPGPTELAWNWRWELGVLGLLTGSLALISSDFGLRGLIAATGAGLAACAALLCSPPARQWLLARAWCVITPHRVRKGCAHAWVQTRSGRLPVIVSAAPAAYGERVRLWLRAGVTAADLEGASDVLAAACWAREVRVVRNTSYAHLVTLEVIRGNHEERGRVPPEHSPDPRRRADGDAADAGERDTPRWPGESPGPRPANLPFRRPSRLPHGA